MQQIGYDLQTWCDNDTASQNVYFVSSAHALFENRKGEKDFISIVISD